MNRAIRYDVRGNNGLAEYPGSPSATNRTADVIAQAQAVLAATAKFLPKRADALGAYASSDLDPGLKRIQELTEELLHETSKLQMIRRASQLSDTPAVLDNRHVQRDDSDYDPSAALQRRISAGQHVRHDAPVSMPVTKADGTNSEEDYDPAERLQRRIHTSR